MLTGLTVLTGLTADRVDQRSAGTPAAVQSSGSTTPSTSNINNHHSPIINPSLEKTQGMSFVVLSPFASLAPLRETQGSPARRGNARRGFLAKAPSSQRIGPRTPPNGCLKKCWGLSPVFKRVGLFTISGLNPGPLIDADGTAQNTGVLHVRSCPAPRRQRRLDSN